LVKTDGEGRFWLQWGNTGNYDLFLRADGYLVERREVTLNNVDAATLDVRFRRAESGRIAGKVVLPDSKTPVPRAWVHVVSQQDRRAEDIYARSPRDFSVQTGDDGNFLVGELDAGVYRLIASPRRDTYFISLIGKNPSPPKPLPAELDNLAPFHQSDIEVASGKETTVPVQLNVGAAISGQVLSTAGTPVAGAMVRVMRDPRVIHTTPDVTVGIYAITDAAGRYRLSGLPPEKYFISVEAKGYKHYNSFIVHPHTPVALPVGETTGVNITFSNPQYRVVKRRGS
jgi:hypothetical protein